MLLSGALPMRLSVVTVAQDEQSLGAVKLITLWVVEFSDQGSVTGWACLEGLLVDLHLYVNSTQVSFIC